MMARQKEKMIYKRFSIGQRLEHWILFISFTLLAVTGLPQKFALSPIPQAIMNFFGGIESTRIIHRTSAAVFTLLGIYHFAIVGYKLFVQRKEASMLPGLQDAKDAIQALLHNLGIEKKAPKLPHFNFTEKMEYWAMIWGGILMGISGYMLWNPIGTAKILPGVFIPAAKALHGGEAILAVLAILIWHFYNVHLKNFNKSMISGKLTREEMEEEHGAALERIESGETRKPVDPALARKRASIYIPVMGTVLVLVTALFFRFITYEETSISTIPDLNQAEVFLPFTPTPLPPTRTPFPTVIARQMDPNAPVISSDSWQTGIAALVDQKCGSCHGTSGGLDLTSYAGLSKGGNSGPAINPGDAENSLLLSKVRDGNHPATFSAAQMAVIAEWIAKGAPEAAP